MAGMKGFYMGLAAIAVIGSGVLWVTNRRAAAVVPVGPIPMDAIASARGFPGYVEGSDDAPVTVIEYADFQCPGCQAAWLLTIQDLKERLVKPGIVKYVFRDFPLEMHNKARQAHHAAACADEQGMFWPMHDQLFGSQNEWSLSAGAPERIFREYAGTVGVNVEEYDACMSEGRYRGRIQAMYEGGIQLGVSSTPTMIVGDQMYSGLTYDQLKQIVDSMIATDSAETQASQ